jgi:hypothetical protein
VGSVPGGGGEEVERRLAAGGGHGLLRRAERGVELIRHLLPHLVWCQGACALVCWVC